MEPPPPHTLLGQLPCQYRGATTLHSTDTKMHHKTSDHRRSNKPIMEKRRRARINHCLGELKGLILDAMKKDPARHSKLEKADILEMTVKHLQNMQRQQLAIAVATDPSVMTKFRTGFGECATEVARYVARIDGVDPAVRQRLLGHLRSCLSGLNQLSPAAFACLVPGLAPTGANANPATNPFLSSGMPPFAHFPFSGMGSGTDGLHLFPSRLPNGDIAFVLPNTHHQQQQQQQPPVIGLSGPPSPTAGSPCSSPSPTPPSAPPSAPLMPAAHLPPAFPTNPPLVATISSSVKSERRTPSAFTSVPLLSAGSLTLPPAAPLSTSPLLDGCRAASPSPGSSSASCTVSSTTTTVGSCAFDADATSTLCSPPPIIKRESGETWPLLPTSTTLRHQQQLHVSPPGSSTTTTTGDHHHSPQRHHASKSRARTSKGGGGLDEEVPVVLLVKAESGAVASSTATGDLPYDLSRPSTSGVCSMTENDVMWRPW